MKFLPSVVASFLLCCLFQVTHAQAAITDLHLVLTPEEPLDITVGGMDTLADPLIHAENIIYTAAFEISTLYDVALIDISVGTVEGDTSIVNHSFIPDANPVSPYTFNREASHITISLGTYDYHVPVFLSVKLKYVNGSYSEPVTVSVNNG
jgi:hypothetical protein